MNRKGIFFAILAAALYAVSIPFSKLLLPKVSVTMMAAFMYLGAGIGMSVLSKLLKHEKEMALTKTEIPYTIAMVILDILAPVLLMAGLSRTASESVSLLNNFEIVATSLIALVFFHERISQRLWLAIVLVTISSMLISVEDLGKFRFSTGAVMVLLATICWGLENNCSRKLSSKSPFEIVIIKGFGSGAGALAIAFIAGESLPSWTSSVAVLALGFISYGLSIFFYIYAQRFLGAARTSTFYAIAPFIGVILGWIVFQDAVKPVFLMALALMLAGTYFASTMKGPGESSEGQTVIQQK